MADNVRKWTAPQREAIDSRNGTVLVSAAAGSGKTAVLTQRIIEMLLDKEHPGDISRMLVVTFTRAAAAELRERIGGALKSEMKNNPDSADRLREQYLLLSGAKISTVHSFCLDVIKSKFAQLGLSSKVRVLDDGHAKLISARIMNEVIESFYESDEASEPSFSLFADNLISLHDEGLAQLLIKIYVKISSFADGIDFIKKCAEDYELCSDKDFVETKWGSSVIAEIKALYSSYSSICSAACKIIEENDEFLPYLSSFEYDLHHTESVLLSLDDMTKEAVQKIREYTPIPLGRVKTELQTEEIKFLRSMRTDFSSARSELIAKYFTESDEFYQRSAKESAAFCRMLYSVLSEFEKRYSAEKNKRSVLDYGDLERLTLNLLLSDNVPTDVAKELAIRFDEVMIDEYQDINDVQDAIFSSFTSLLSENGEHGSRRFMVGDVKQSIYGFRGAEPSIFARYRFTDFVKKVFLSHNFRCDEKIINFANDVCGFLFKNASELPYHSGVDDLVFAKTSDREAVIPKILLVETPVIKDDVKVSPTYYEALEVAENIKRMVAVEGRKPSDIAILLRSSVAASYYERALDEKGLLYTNTCTADLFTRPEVLLAVSLLNCINNPTSDIHLAATLKSPIFGFTLDDLVNIRTAHKEGNLFDALTAYANNVYCGKTLHFFDKLKEYRTKAEAEKVDSLLRYIYSDTHILQAVCGDDIEKRDNLLIFYELARNYESGSFKGLYNFISHINELISTHTVQKETRSDSEKSLSVSIMTIHQSKGLEFPVCFVCDTARKPNRVDTRERVIIDKDLGIAPKLSDETGYAYYDTAFRKAQAAYSLRKMNEEEIRILYVALTRAREELYVSASLPDTDKFLKEIADYSKISRNCPEYFLQKTPSFIKWILYALKCTESISAEIIRCLPGSNDAVDAGTPTVETRNSSEISPYDGALTEEIKKRLQFEYSYGSISDIPAKTSVSDLTPSFLDADVDAEFGGLTTIRRRKTPKFINENEETADYAKIGTATHLFMQFCDFSNAEKNGLSNEKERLVSKGFISQTDADRIDLKKVEGFLKSRLYSDMSGAVDLYRELRFNVKLPASDFTVDPKLKAELEGEDILVQGVIDCVFEQKDGTLVIADYKTDSIPREYENDAEGFKDLLRHRHSKQLGYYKTACEIMFQKKVSRGLVYSFSLNDTVEIF